MTKPLDAFAALAAIAAVVAQSGGAVNLLAMTDLALCK